MNVFIKTGLTIALGLFFAWIFSLLLEKGQLKYHVHRSARMQELFVNNTGYDIIFIGSSRTHTAIDPGIIDSLTGLKTYNAGMEGARLPEFKLVLDGYLQVHPSPRMIVLTVDGQSFDADPKMFFSFQYLWVMQNPAIKEEMKKRKEFRFAFINSGPLLRQIYYDDYTKVLAVKGILGQTELKGGGKERKGYFNQKYHCADTSVKYDMESVGIDESAVHMLQAIIDTCRTRDIKLVFTYAPEYDFRRQSSIRNFDKFIRTFTGIAREQGIPFFREDKLLMCKDPCLFADYGHVNISGSEVYSALLGQRIRDSLLKN